MKTYYSNPDLNEWANRNGGACFGEKTMLEFLAEAQDMVATSGWKLQAALDEVISYAI